MAKYDGPFDYKFRLCQTVEGADLRSDFGSSLSSHPWPSNRVNDMKTDKDYHIYIFLQGYFHRCPRSSYQILTDYKLISVQPYNNPMAVYYIITITTGKD